MRITKWGEYGILCCLYLARKSPSESVGAAELARYQAIPLQYTQQILQRLRRGGIIASVRGPGGGYKLARDAAKISLKDILQTAEGDTFQVICNTNTISCHNGSSACPLKPVWKELKSAVDALLANKTLASLVTNGAAHLISAPDSEAHG